MSVTPSVRPTRTTVPALRARKASAGEGAPIVALTAYTAPVARLLDPWVDLLLVGDSLGMVVYGEENTLNVPLEWMIAHGRAVAQQARHALVVVDMPFGTVQASKETAFENCARVMKESGAQAVKIEGGQEMAETIRYLTSRGIPVLGHVGLLPQYVHAVGGFKRQGKDEATRTRIIADAKAVQEAGAFAMVAEAVTGELAAALTEACDAPIIGIGANHPCDGQVLVIDDILGLTPRAPSFAPRYVDVASQISEAAQRYAQEVRDGTFSPANPQDEQQK
jgi:3-methyl-2-oxobutanoate hydroxymethyltransferase